MEPVEFLQRVLPSTGLYCVAELDSKKKQHKFVNTIAGVLEGSAEHVHLKLNSYFALASFTKDGARTAANVSYMRSLFVDVDCGKGKYANKKEALLAARKFLKDTELLSIGSPIIVDSGGGIHIYWPMDRDIPMSEWLPVARNLKKLCLEQEFKIDQSVTGDAARVLRVPGSYNFKYISEDKPDPMPCAIKVDGDTVFNFETFAEAIKSKLLSYPADEVLEIPGTAPKKKASTFKIVDGSGNKFKLLLDKSMQGQGCAQLKHYVENAADEGMEPLWRGLLSWSMKCEDSEEFNKYLSDLHPYDEDRMQAKLRDIKGPYPCTKMQELNDGVCAGCSHYGKVTNPLVLARYIKTDEEEKEIALEVQESVSAPQNKITRPPAPRGFGYAQGGGVVMHKKIEKKGEGDEELTKDIRLLDYDLFVVHILNIDRTHTVYMVADKKTGPETIIFPQRAIVSKDETLKSLAEQNVMALYGTGNDANLYTYVRAAVEEASRTHNAMVVPANYGWQEDGSIVCHERIYNPDGSVTTFPMPSLDALNKKFKIRGSSMEPWLNVVKMLVAREEWMLLGFGLVGAASLLMKYAGVNGVVFHACGKTGAGKSLALSLSGGMFGHPSMIGVASSSSEIALIEAASEFNSFGLLMDESTTQQDKQTVGNSKLVAAQRNAWAKSVIYRMSEGTPKDRSTTKGGLQVGRGGWKSLLLTTSNSYLMDSLVSQDNSSEAVIMRLLEAGFYTEMTLSEQEQENLSALREHHGHVGEKYIRWLVQRDAEVALLFKDCRKKLTELIGFKGSERFWFDGGAAIVCAAIILGSKYANIIDIPVKKIIDCCVVPLIQNGRKYVGLSQKDADDVLNSYTRERYGQLVVVRRSDASKVFEAVLGHGALIDETISRSNIAGRVEHDITPGRIDYYIEIRLLRQHCSAIGYSFEQFKKEMERKYHVEYLKKKDLLAKTKGPEMRVAAMRISKPDSSLEETGD
jgi:hypothetical protein